MKLMVTKRRSSHFGYLRKVASALAMFAIALVVGISARTATINRQRQPWESTRILTGIVSDSMCGRGHTMNGQGDAECTRLCVKLGYNYALVVGRSLFILQGHETELNKFAGDIVMVTGTVRRDTVTVESIATVERAHSPESVSANGAGPGVQ